MTSSVRKYAEAIVEALRPDEPLTVSQWAERSRVLPADTPEPGVWRNERAPYLVDIQDTMSPGSRFREGWVMKGHQVGGSSAGENFIGASICGAAGSILVVFATLEDAKQWEAQRFEPMRAASPELRRRVRGANAAGSRNTKLRKRYPGGVMRLVSANRVGGLKSATMRYVKFEEPDEYVQDLDNQGNPIALGSKRTSNYGDRAKIYGDGTPTIEKRSAIEKHHGRGDRRVWHVPCPECRHFQPFDWKRFEWDGNLSDAVKVTDAGVRMKCEACGNGFTERQWKARSYARPRGVSEEEARAAGLAHWRATAKGEPGVASWHLPSLMAPLGWRDWWRLAAGFDSAKKAEAAGDADALKEFTNNELGLTWAEKLRSSFSADKLRERRENYALMTVPPRGLVLVAAVDTQDNRLALEIRAYGRGEESFGIHHGEIYGTPASPMTWEKLRQTLEAPVKHASGHPIALDVAFIDCGGHYDAEVKLFCRDAQARGLHWVAIRGASQILAKPLGEPKHEEIDWQGQKVAGGADVRHLGTQRIKHLLHNRISTIEKHGPGYVHWPLGYSDEYFDQVCAERRELRKDRQGNKSLVWVSTGARNEGWDLLVYGYAAYLYAVSGQNTEAILSEREAKFSKKPEEILQETKRIASPAPRRGNFATNWR